MWCSKANLATLQAISYNTRQTERHQYLHYISLTLSTNWSVQSELLLLKPKPVSSRKRLKTPSKQNNCRYRLLGYFLEACTNKIQDFQHTTRAVYLLHDSATLSAIHSVIHILCSDLLCCW